MAREIKTVTVFGAGTMGGGIAALMANAGLKVHLLDIPPRDPKKGRNELAEKKIAEMRKASADPAKDPINGALMHPSFADRIIPGNSVDDLARCAAESDLIIEAIPDKLEWKVDLYKKIFSAARPGTIVSSNTSTLPLKKLVAELPPDRRKDFMITHFFNPARFMELVELVKQPETDFSAYKEVRDLLDKKAGKIVLDCKDTPGFIANRIGTYFLMRAIVETLDRGFTIEEADAMLGRPLGMQKSGIFGTLDLVGLGLVPDITQNFIKTLDKTDPFLRLNYTRALQVVEEMIKDGRTGRASDKGGFYRLLKDEDGNKREKESMNLLTGEYAPSVKPKLKAAKAGLSGPRAVLETKDRHGDFAWKIIRDTILYASSLVPEIADRIQDVDAAMRAGYGWKYGPFEMIDKCGIKANRKGLSGLFNKVSGKKDTAGVEWFVKRAQRDGCVIPPLLQLANNRNFYSYDDKGRKQALDFNFPSGFAAYQPMRTPKDIVDLGEIKRRSKPLITRGSASVWDIGDGVLCLEFHSMKNMMDPSILSVLNDTIRKINESRENGGEYKGLVIYNDGPNFSPGANLPFVSLRLHWARTPFTLINEAIHNGLTIPVCKMLKVPRMASEALHRGTRYVATLLDKAQDLATFGLRRKWGDEYLKQFVHEGQAVYDALHKASFPSVAAGGKFILGGGYEIMANASAIQVHAESYMGLPEMGVGLMPGWTGHVRLLERIMDSPDFANRNDIYPAVRRAFENIMAPVFSISRSAPDAAKKYWLRPGIDGITMKRERVLADAKARVLSMVDGYEPPKPRTFNLPGKTANASLQMGVDSFSLKGLATGYDVLIGDAVGDTLTGGDTHKGISLHQNQIYQRELENITSLAAQDHTLRRIDHMVLNNSMLREDNGMGYAATPREMREQRMPVTLPLQEYTGKPLEGEAAYLLRRRADHTGMFRWAAAKLGFE